MYFKDFFLGLRRRWYIALAGLLLTAGLAYQAVQFVPVTYTSTTSILMLPPQSSVGSKGNPYLNLGGLGQALEVLSTRVNASEAVEDYLKRHPDATTVVGPDATTTGPILLISSTANSPQESLEIRDQLTAIVPRILVDMQNDLQVRPTSRITSSMLASDREPKREIKSQLRAIIAIVAVGGAGTILGTGYLDFLLAIRSGAPVRRRRRRRSAEEGSPVWWDVTAPDPGSQ